MPLDASHLWPGGIPSSVTIQLEPELPDDKVKEECKAWLLFLSVGLLFPPVLDRWPADLVGQNWVTLQAAGAAGNSTDYRVRQRRELVVKWANADQSLRDVCLPENHFLSPF